MPGLSDHTLALAAELLEDIELSRLAIEPLLLKATRLARLVADDEMAEWLRMELRGYSDTDIGRKYMTRTGRWTDRDANQGYWNAITELDARIRSHETLLASMSLPNLSGDHVTIAIRETRNAQIATAQAVASNSSIRSKVIAVLHEFVATRYYELAFSEQQASLFERARVQVDSLLAPLSGETLAKVDSIYRRLDESDPEAVSQALTTCRRLIDSVANAIFPPRDETATVGENELRLTEQHVQNRLNVYVRERVESESRRDKMRRTLKDLYERVSAGVHADVSVEEARFLFLSTYLYLGEVLSLDDRR